MYAQLGRKWRVLKYNKAFKGDSQRLAVLSTNLGWVFTVKKEGFVVSVARTLTRRYNYMELSWIF
ncbi:hypothetical protein GCM10007931_12880 [Vibrio algivorus]|uniref:Uncharacterized protein n=1 Tax=Vibrio algivorus TaxID=1667024 RepID=A0ABQ6EMF0_9VIBR|nr:hypothetical protein GCM10007931_12880 [Vibrio algivorus]